MKMNEAALIQGLGREPENLMAENQGLDVDNESHPSLLALMNGL
jgi:hypothetical protein